MDHIIPEIARQVGTSTRTVYRVLNERSTEKSAPTKASALRIRALAEQLGYQPNLAARSTRTRQFRAIGLLMGTHPSASTFPLILLKGLVDALDRAGFNLLVLRMPDERLADRQGLPKILRGLCIDALVVHYTHDLPPGLAKSLNASRLPTIFLNIDHPTGALRCADREAGAEVGRRLLALGHRRIAWLAPAGAKHYSVDARRDGCATALAQANTALISYEHPACPGDQTKPGDNIAVAVRTWLTEQRPQAVVCYDLDQALAVHHAASAGGWRIPEDLSIVTFTQTHEDPMGLGLSRMVCNAYELGARAGAIALAAIADPLMSHQPTEAMPFTWWQGHTTGPARSSP